MLTQDELNALKHKLKGEYTTNKRVGQSAIGLFFLAAGLGFYLKSQLFIIGMFVCGMVFLYQWKKLILIRKNIRALSSIPEGLRHTWDNLVKHSDVNEMMQTLKELNRLPTNAEFKYVLEKNKKDLLKIEERQV